MTENEALEISLKNRSKTMDYSLCIFTNLKYRIETKFSRYSCVSLQKWQPALSKIGPKPWTIAFAFLQILNGNGLK